jgi:uncharacterized membrane protein AbrB (regulator of aidB expression)
MKNPEMNEQLVAVVRDGVGRAAGVVGLAGIGLIHLLDLPGKFAETPYLAWMYIALIASAIVCAFELVRTGSPRAWLGGALLAGGAIIGYTLTRTTGLPQAHGDVGNWLEPLGLASLFVEASLVSLSAYMLWIGSEVKTFARPRVGVLATR